MGGTFVTLQLEPLVDQPQRPPAELRDAVWKVVEGFMHWRCNTGPYLKTFEEYLPDVAHRGRAEGSGGATPQQLHFDFPELAGLCPLSSMACAHWTRLGIACRLTELGRLATSHGYAFLGPRTPPGEVLAAPMRFPLIEYKRRLYFIDHGEGAETQLIADEDVPRVAFAALDPGHQLQVTEMIAAKRCGCRMCKVLRKYKTL